MHQLYLATEQLSEEAYGRNLRSVNVAVRSGSTPEQLRPELMRTLARLDPELPVYEMRTAEQLLGASVDAQRFATLQLVLFALLALVRAVLGLYAVLSYSVAQRTHEIGIRMALGAPPQLVLRQVGDRAWPGPGIGLAVGLLGAVATTRLLRSVVETVRPPTHWCTWRPCSVCSPAPCLPRGSRPGGRCAWMPRWLFGTKARSGRPQARSRSECCQAGLQSARAGRPPSRGGLSVAQEGAPGAGEWEAEPVDAGGLHPGSPSGSASLPAMTTRIPPGRT